MFDQAIAGRTPVPNASITASSGPALASSDAALIALWLDGRPPTTWGAYEADVAALLTCFGDAIALNAFAVPLET